MCENIGLQRFYALLKCLHIQTSEGYSLMGLLRVTSQTRTRWKTTLQHLQSWPCLLPVATLIHQKVMSFLPSTSIDFTGSIWVWDKVYPLPCLAFVQHYSCEIHLCCANACRWLILLAIIVCMDPTVLIHSGASGLSQALLNTGALSTVIHVLWGTYVHILKW